MDFKVIWSDSAISDLKEICDYIARDKPNAAEKVGRGILEHVKLLESFHS
jgi:plasmid stabilization system protein ParE